MPRVEINNGGHQVVVDDPNGQRDEVARAARKLWEQTRIKPSEAGFQKQTGLGFDQPGARP